MKIKTSDILYFVLLFFYIEPAFFQVNNTLHNVFLVGQLFSFSILLFIYATQKIKPSFIVIILWIFLFELCLACHYGYGNIKTTISTFISYIGLSMWVDIYLRKNTKKCFNMILALLDIYVVINFLSFLIYPNGMFISQSFQNTPYICWFLGYKNPQIRLLLPYVALLFARDSIFYKKIHFSTYLKLLLMAFISLKLKSATGIFGVFLFIILNLVFSHKKISRFKRLLLKCLNLKTVFYVLIVVNVLVIFFNFQNYFSFLIVNVLHRNLDLTDRIFVWQKVIPVIKNHFLLGHGVIYAELSRNLIGASHAHNYFLNILYNGGILSFIFISSIWIAAGRKSSISNNSLGVRFLKFMAIIFLIMGITESLTFTVLLYPVLVMLYYSEYLEKIELSEGDNS